MDVDGILRGLNTAKVDYVLIGGMNFFLVHAPVATFDVDIFISDEDENPHRTRQALAGMGAEVSFSPKADDWHLVETEPSANWLRRRAVHCLNTLLGAVGVFRAVDGLEKGFSFIRPFCPMRTTPAGTPFRSLSDEFMISCQLSLPLGLRKQDRLKSLGYGMQ